MTPLAMCISCPSGRSMITDHKESEASGWVDEGVCQALEREVEPKIKEKREGSREGGWKFG